MSKFCESTIDSRGARFANSCANANCLSANPNFERHLSSQAVTEKVAELCH